MNNIRLTRIDHRLVHGQVATHWCGKIGANMIVVANDEAAKNKLKQTLMDMAAPSYVAMRYWTIEKTIAELPKLWGKHKIFLVCSSPQDVLALVKGGISIDKVDVGNMPMLPGKHFVTGTVAVDDEDIDTFTALREAGVEIEMQNAPDVSMEIREKLFEKAKM